LKVIVFVTEKNTGASLTSSRVVKSTEERSSKKRSSGSLIGVIKFMTNGKEQVVIRVTLSRGVW
jgi:hypothetical protein